MATTSGVAQLDQATLDRKLKACIDKFPVVARHEGRQFNVRFNGTQDITQLLDGGTLDNMTIQVVAPRSVFADRQPKSLDAFELLVHNEWVMFQVRDVPTYYDPITPQHVINLQSPDKGVE